MLCSLLILVQLIGALGVVGRLTSSLECCSGGAAACHACREGVSVDELCGTLPESFACRNPEAPACNASLPSPCPQSQYCVMGVCLNAPSCSTVPLPLDTHQRFCRAVPALPPPAPCAPGFYRGEDGRCEMRGCCTQPGVAVCIACLSDEPVGVVCSRQPALVGCPLCACGADACVVSVSQGRDRTVSSRCDGSGSPTPADVECEEKSLLECDDSLTCGRALLGGQWQCQPLTAFCSSCARSGGACSLVGHEMACVPPTEQPYDYCPPERRCHGADPSNAASHFCCESGMVCDMEVLYGGPFALFGGRCAFSHDPCKFHPCMPAASCIVREGVATCIPFHPLAPLPCPVGQRAVVTGGVEGCVAYEPPADYPCNEMCGEGEFCSVSVVDGSRAAACVSTGSNEQAACNMMRTQSSLPTCAYGCTMVGNTASCITPPYAGLTCRETVWPPTDTIPCMGHSDCPANQYCTNFLPQPVCNGLTGAVSMWLETGMRSCQPSLFDCVETQRGAWSSDEAEYCCRKRQIGCDAWNCYDSDTDSWPSTQRAFCCKHTGLGCSAGPDCTSDYTTWSPKKQAHCCVKENICPRGFLAENNGGCPEVRGCHLDYCLPNTLPWTQAKADWCCKIEQVGCRVQQEVDCYDGALSAQDKAWCCGMRNMHCSYDCVTGAVNASQWSEPKQQYCCDTFSVGCAEGYSVLECADPKQLDDTSQQRCCELHNMGCTYDCHDTRLLGANSDAADYCCAVHGVNCPAPPEAANRTAAAGLRVAFVVLGNWLDVESSPRLFNDRLRASLASCDGNLTKSITHVKVSCISLNKDGYTCQGRDIAANDAWHSRFELSWEGSLAQQYAQRTDTLHSEPSYVWTEEIRVDVDVTSVYAKQIISCLTDTPQQVLSTKGGTAAPVVLGELTTRYRITNHDLPMPVVQDGTPVIPDTLPPLPTEVGRPAVPHDSQAPGPPHLLIVVGIAFGSLVGCGCALAAAFTMRRGGKKAPTHYESLTLSVPHHDGPHGVGWGGGGGGAARGARELRDGPADGAADLLRGGDVPVAQVAALHTAQLRRRRPVHPLEPGYAAAAPALPPRPSRVYPTPVARVGLGLGGVGGVVHCPPSSGWVLGFCRRGFLSGVAWCEWFLRKGRTFSMRERERDMCVLCLMRFAQHTVWGVRKWSVVWCVCRESFSVVCWLFCHARVP